MSGKKDWRLHYPLKLDALRLRSDLEKIAKAERRSLNEIINIACEEYVTRVRHAADA